MNQQKVYLCGPIMGCGDAECKDWRNNTLKRFPNALDPMRRDYRGRYDVELDKEIVELDKQDIDAANAVLVYYYKPSVGTSMEVLYAHTKGKPVVTVAPPGTPLSPWLRYHSTIIVETFEQAYAWLELLPYKACRCLNWADEDMRVRLLTGHHKDCEYGGSAMEAAYRLFKELTRGIECWANEEDGSVFMDCWKAYRKAKALEGVYMPEEQAEDAPLRYAGPAPVLASVEGACSYCGELFTGHCGADLCPRCAPNGEKFVKM